MVDDCRLYHVRPSRNDDLMSKTKYYSYSYTELRLYPRYPFQLEVSNHRVATDTDHNADKPCGPMMIGQLIENDKYAGSLYFLYEL
jgi:hypothetical protein